MASGSDLTLKAREVARHLTYNGKEAEAQAKHLLLEMAHRIDAELITAKVTGGGLTFRNGLGMTRAASIKEKMLFKLFGVLPKNLRS